jgi:homoserine kinase
MSSGWCVRIPATSANLGPGFDCMGMALELYNDMCLYQDEPFSIGIYGESADILPSGPENAVVQAMHRLFFNTDYRSDWWNFRLVLHNHIPVASGLGSSASAVVGGLVLANELVRKHFPKRALSPSELFHLAAEIEGHPDNVAPALAGGACICWRDVSRWSYQSIPLPPTLVLVVATPYFPLLTKDSRAVVPEFVSMVDAVSNIAQTARLVAALCTGDLRSLENGLEDRLHEPYRMALIPGSVEVRSAALERGALLTSLSGAGPSLLAWCDSRKIALQVADEMSVRWRELGVSCTTHVFRPHIGPVRVVEQNS